MTAALLRLCFGTMLLATSAFAFPGVDLSMGGCPGNSGAIGGYVQFPDPFPPQPPPPPEPCYLQTASAYVDCASGAPTTLLVTWAPQEAIPDLVGVDGLLEFCVPGGLEASPFWNFDSQSCNGAALNASHLRPPHCTLPAYADVWNRPGAGSAIAAIARSPYTGRIAFTCYSPVPVSVTSNQRLFGGQIIIDGSAAAEAGGSCQGCCGEVVIYVLSLTPGSAGAVTTSQLTGPTGFSSGFSQGFVLGGNPGTCSPVKTRSTTWGRLKMLYR